MHQNDGDYSIKSHVKLFPWEDDHQTQTHQTRRTLNSNDKTGNIIETKKTNDSFLRRPDWAAKYLNN